MKFLKFILALIIIPFAISAASDNHGKKAEYVIDNAKSSMIIKGGSTVGDWEADVTVINASFSVNLEALQTADANNAFELSSFSIPVNDIQSDGSRMTKNIHKYLEKKDHPQILFTLKDSQITLDPDSDGKRFNIESNGTINAAGVNSDVTLNLMGELQDDGSIHFSGVQNINFSDYEIDRPSAMLGTVKAKEEMEIYYSLYLVKK